jgi:hypothetical protein
MKQNIRFFSRARRYKPARELFETTIRLVYMGLDRQALMWIDFESQRAGLDKYETLHSSLSSFLCLVPSAGFRSRFKYAPVSDKSIFGRLPKRNERVLQNVLRRQRTCADVLWIIRASGRLCELYRLQCDR